MSEENKTKKKMYIALPDEISNHPDLLHPIEDYTIWVEEAHLICHPIEPDRFILRIQVEGRAT